MSKESNRIVDAYSMGMHDAKVNKGYKNTYTKRDKRNAYHQGYIDWIELNKKPRN